jgi:hypothetical protein
MKCKGRIILLYVAIYLKKKSKLGVRCNFNEVKSKLQTLLKYPFIVHTIEESIDIFKVLPMNKHLDTSGQLKGYEAMKRNKI